MQRVRACAKDSLLICRCAGLPSLAAGSELAAFPPEGPRETIDLSGTVGDFGHPDFNASPFGGLGHDTGNVAAGLGAGARPTFVGAGLKVVSQWHDAASRPIAPDVSAVGGGEPGPASNAQGQIRGRNTRVFDSRPTRARGRDRGELPFRAVPARGIRIQPADQHPLGTEDSGGSLHRCVRLTTLARHVTPAAGGWSAAPPHPPTPPAGGHRRRLVHGEGVQPWQAHTQLAASGNGAAPA